MVQTVEAAVPDTAEFQEQDEEYQSGKIYCANCIHCKVVPAKSDKDDQYVLRTRCAAGKWKKKLGEEKLYKYCTITRRYLDSCNAYEAMGDAREFIRELKKTLPGKDVVYPCFWEQENQE
ncbi:MAG: hypothetical protein LBC62_03355 [Treponema sp.]|jgi:hypothetical protein|nr:hypothetical protein [Treponema sp.]